MKRFLVTGGSGFIGSNFIRHFLREQNDVSIINLDKLTYAGNPENTKDFDADPRYRFVKGDICDPEIVSDCMKNVEGVVHFASETHVDRSIESGQNFMMTNVVGTGILLEAAKKFKIQKFLHFSTDEVYGSCQTGSFTEESPLNPSSPYSAAKAGSDLLALAYARTHQLPVTIIRASNNFGPYQYPEKVIPLFITNLIEGKKVPLYGSGQNVRDWLYVGDCVRAVSFILKQGKNGEVYHVGGNHEVNNLELTHLILEVFGKNDSLIQYVPDRLAHDFRYSLKTEKLSQLGFSVKPEFKKRLLETIEWYRTHVEWWKPLKRDVFTLK